MFGWVFEFKFLYPDFSSRHSLRGIEILCCTTKDFLTHTDHFEPGNIMKLKLCIWEPRAWNTSCLRRQDLTLPIDCKAGLIIGM